MVGSLGLSARAVILSADKASKVALSACIGDISWSSGTSQDSRTLLIRRGDLRTLGVLGLHGLLGAVSALPPRRCLPG